MKKEEINKVIETTLSGNIATFDTPMKIKKDDPTMGGRNKLTKKQVKFAVDELLNK